MDVTETLNRLKKAYSANSMNELANVMGVSITTFNTWRNRKKIPKKYLLECSRLTKYSYEWLLGEDKESMNYQNIMGNYNVQIYGENNSLSTKQDGYYAELFELIKKYASPTIIQDFKNKLLKIKEIHENQS